MTIETPTNLTPVATPKGMRFDFRALYTYPDGRVFVTWAGGTSERRERDGRMFSGVDAALDWLREKLTARQGEA